MSNEDILSEERGGHLYEEQGSSDCGFRCGCYMANFSSGGPDGVDPYGKCPNNPINNKENTMKKPSRLKDGDNVSGVVVTIYAATRNSDLNEGRGVTVVSSYHKDERSAVIGCKGISVMGSNGEVARKLAILLEDGRYFSLPDEGIPILMTPDQEEVQTMENLRKEAIKKLSPAERAALGL